MASGESDGAGDVLAPAARARRGVRVDLERLLTLDPPDARVNAFVSKDPDPACCLIEVTGLDAM